MAWRLVRVQLTWQPRERSSVDFHGVTEATAEPPNVQKQADAVASADKAGRVNRELVPPPLLVIEQFGDFVVMGLVRIEVGTFSKAWPQISQASFLAFHEVDVEICEDR